MNLFVIIPAAVLILAGIIIFISKRREDRLAKEKAKKNHPSSKSSIPPMDALPKDEQLGILDYAIQKEKGKITSITRNGTTATSLTPKRVGTAQVNIDKPTTSRPVSQSFSSHRGYEQHYTNNDFPSNAILAAMIASSASDNVSQQEIDDLKQEIEAAQEAAAEVRESTVAEVVPEVETSSSSSYDYGSSSDSSSSNYDYGSSSSNYDYGSSSSSSSYSSSSDSNSSYLSSSDSSSSSFSFD